MDGNATKWIAVVVALVIGGVVGYFIGVGKAANINTTDETSVVDEISQDVETPANPFQDSGYQNPFEQVRVNPFSQ